MSEEPNSSQESPDEGAEQTAPLGWRERWRPTIFVAVFMSITLLLLVGYRYNVDTRYNDWYLFQVARHTVMALNWIGDYADLEHSRDKMGEPRTLRARLMAWERGDTTERPEDYIAASSDPLTEWEAWSYRANEMRQTGAPGEHGPRVEFVMRRGLSIKIRDLDEAARKQMAEGTATEEELAGIRTQLESMRRQLTINRTTPDQRDPDPTYMFVFIVVSECGAIEVMSIFLAAVIAFPTRWRKKLVGIVAGVPIMYALNIFRLTCLAVIGAYDTRHIYFNFAHEYVWQAIYIVFVVAVWMFWVEYVVRGRWRKRWERTHPETTISRSKSSLWLFFIKFLLIIMVLVTVWWQFLMPAYGWLLSKICMALCNVFFGMDLTASRVITQGLFNVDSMIEFTRGEHRPALSYALLVTNVCPYVALVLATSGIRMWNRLRVLAYGVGILAAGHVIYMCIMLRFQETLQVHTEITIAMTLLFLTLPFLLWIVLAYWPRVAMLAREEAEQETEERPVPGN